jgi:hypothetical protein
MLTAIVIVAVLFAVYGLVRPRVGCTHNCGFCPKACGTPEPEHDA